MSQIPSVENVVLSYFNLDLDPAEDDYACPSYDELQRMHADLKAAFAARLHTEMDAMRKRVESVVRDMERSAEFSRRLVQGSPGPHSFNDQLALMAAECREGDVVRLREALVADASLPS